MENNDSYDNDKEYYDLQSEYEQDLIDTGIKDLSYDKIRDFLGRYGDSIYKRVNSLIKDSKQLLNNTFFGPSLVLSTSAIEIIIRYLLIRPLVQGAFLSDEWANILSMRIINGKSYRDREMLPLVLINFEIDIKNIRISENKLLWETIKSEVFKKRNLYVHQGDEVTADVANISLSCVKQLLNIVYDISIKFGFTLNSTGKWSKIINGHDEITKTNFSKTFEEIDIFSNGA